MATAVDAQHRAVFSAFKAQVEKVLRCHGEEYLQQFNILQPEVIINPDKEEDKNKKPNIWSLEIGPREGICAFSKPLIIASETVRGRKFVRVAHYWADVWDIMYDPILEFMVEPDSAWTPFSIFQHHSGYKEIADVNLADIVELTMQWTETLEERGYHDTRQAIA
ncbi:hypothetical protein HDU76_003231, partial [Blyttiomyces sp. JEL0837]